jgi:hypothetical protein
MRRVLAEEEYLVCRDEYRCKTCIKKKIPICLRSYPFHNKAGGCLRCVWDNVNPETLCVGGFQRVKRFRDGPVLAFLSTLDPLPPWPYARTDTTIRVGRPESPSEMQPEPSSQSRESTIAPGSERPEAQIAEQGKDVARLMTIVQKLEAHDSKRAKDIAMMPTQIEVLKTQNAEQASDIETMTRKLAQQDEEAVQRAKKAAMLTADSQGLKAIVAQQADTIARIEKRLQGLEAQVAGQAKSIASGLQAVTDLQRITGVIGNEARETVSSAFQQPASKLVGQERSTETQRVQEGLDTERKLFLQEEFEKDRKVLREEMTRERKLGRAEREKERALGRAEIKSGYEPARVANEEFYKRWQKESEEDSKLRQEARHMLHTLHHSKTEQERMQTVHHKEMETERELFREEMETERMQLRQEVDLHRKEVTLFQNERELLRKEVVLIQEKFDDLRQGFPDFESRMGVIMEDKHLAYREHVSSHLAQEVHQLIDKHVDHKIPMLIQQQFKTMMLRMCDDNQSDEVSDTRPCKRRSQSDSI